MRLETVAKSAGCQKQRVTLVINSKTLGKVMKKIIKGKLYNTETAKEIGKCDADCGRSDFRYFKESLYKKKTGEFFLAGEGHGMTKYASCYGGACGWGSEIFPLELEEAKQWVEKYMTADDCK